MVVAGLGLSDRFAQDVEVFPRQHHTPILADNILDDTADLSFKVHPRLMEVAPGDHDGSSVWKQSAIAKQRLGCGEIQRGKVVRREASKRASRSREANTDICARLKKLIVVRGKHLRQGAGSELSCLRAGETGASMVGTKITLNGRVKRGEREENVVCGILVSQLINQDVGVVRQSQLNGLFQSQAQFSVRKVIAQVLRVRDLRRQAGTVDHFAPPLRRGKGSALGLSRARRKPHPQKSAQSHNN